MVIVQFADSVYFGQNFFTSCVIFACKDLRCYNEKTDHKLFLELFAKNSQKNCNIPLYIVSLHLINSEKCQF